MRLPTKPANTDPCALLSAALVASTAAVDAQPLIMMQHPRPRKTLGLGVTISMVNVGCLTCVVWWCTQGTSGHMGWRIGCVLTTTRTVVRLCAG